MPSEEYVRRILDHHADALAKLPNVVGLGVGEVNPGQAVVNVYVSAKVPEQSLEPSDVVPRSLHAVIAGKPVSAETRVVEVGTITR